MQRSPTLITSHLKTLLYSHHEAPGPLRCSSCARRRRCARSVRSVDVEAETSLVQSGASFLCESDRHADTVSDAGNSLLGLSCIRLHATVADSRHMLLSTANVLLEWTTRLSVPKSAAAPRLYAVSWAVIEIQLTAPQLDTVKLPTLTKFIVSQTCRTPTRLPGWRFQLARRGASWLSQWVRCGGLQAGGERSRQPKRLDRFDGFCLYLTDRESQFWLTHRLS